MKDENRIEKFSTHWQRNFENEPYYSDRYSWDDYDPAYRYAYKSYEENPNTRFEDLETRMEAGWDIAKGKSKLAWVDAKQADASEAVVALEKQVEDDLNALLDAMKRMPSTRKPQSGEPGNPPSGDAGSTGRPAMLMEPDQLLPSIGL